MGVRDPQEPLQARKLAGLSQEAPHPAWLQKLRRNPARPQPHLCTRCRGNSQRWRGAVGGASPGRKTGQRGAGQGTPDPTRPHNEVSAELHANLLRRDVPTRQGA